MRTAFDAARKVLGDNRLHGANLTRAMTREIERLREIVNPGDAAAYEETQARLTENAQRIEALERQRRWRYRFLWWGDA